MSHSRQSSNFHCLLSFRRALSIHSKCFTSELRTAELKRKHRRQDTFLYLFFVISSHSLTLTWMIDSHGLTSMSVPMQWPVRNVSPQKNPPQFQPNLEISTQIVAHDFLSVPFIHISWTREREVNFKKCFCVHSCSGSLSSSIGPEQLEDRLRDEMALLLPGFKSTRGLAVCVV